MAYSYTVYQQYLISTQDRDLYNFMYAVAGATPGTGALLDMSPNTACALFGIPIPWPSGNLDLIDTAILFAGNSDGTVAVQVATSLPNVFLFPDNDDGVEVHGDTGIQGGVGQRRLVKWSGGIVFRGGQQPSTTTPTAIPQRRWIGGLELQPTGEGGSSFTNGAGSRQASRIMDGLGYAIRGNLVTNSWTRALNEYGAFTSRKSWERLYFRPRTPGSGIVGFWYCTNSVAPAAGAALIYSPTGTIDLYTISNVSVPTLRMSGYTPPAGDWVKLDIFLQFPASGAEDGRVLLCANGTPVYDFTDSTGGGMDTIGFHSTSLIGKGVGIGALGTADAVVEYDLDDWMNAEWPNQAGVLFLDNMDFFMGSHIRKANNISGTAAAYVLANAYQITNQMVNPGQAASSALVSGTSGALINCLTDLPVLGDQDRLAGVAYGAVAAVVGINSINAASNDGQLGYSVAGGAAVMATINEVNSATFNSVRYQPSGLIAPVEITPFTTRFTKSADVNTGTVNGMLASVEYIGVWGKEDVLDPTMYPDDYPRDNNIHNCFYPNTPYGYITATQETMLNVVGGTYTGNGTQQSIVLPDACHLLFIRGTTAGVLGAKWFACNLGGHAGGQERVIPNAPVRVWFDDSTSQFKFTVTGTYVETNQNAIVYQYVAVCDPGMRACCGGAFTHITGATAVVNPLQNPNFLPEFIFVQGESLGNTTTQMLRVKGPGNTGTVGNAIDGSAAVANVGSLSLGVYTSGANVHVSGQQQQSYLAFRSIEPGCGWVSIQVMTYTGDGTASRNITLTPASNRFPLFVLVVPTSGAQHAVFRDPSHAGANSATFDALGNTITGITAGAIDRITVGISLNANAVVYNVFCIPGDILGWNNGTFMSPNCFNPYPYVTPTPGVLPDIAVMGNGGLVLNGSVPITLLKDISGIYTLVPGKTNDTLIDRQTGVASVDVKIPDPFAKTGFIGG